MERLNQQAGFDNIHLYCYFCLRRWSFSQKREEMKTFCLYALCFTAVFLVTESVSSYHLRDRARLYHKTLVTHEIVKVPYDINKPQDGHREVHIEIESVPISVNGIVSTCIIRWRDSAGENNKPLKVVVENLSFLERIAMLLYYGGNSMQLEHKWNEDKRPCTSKIGIVKLKIYNEKGQGAAFINAQIYTPSQPARQKRRNIDSER